MLRCSRFARLRKVYDGHGRQVEAIADLTFAVAAGQFVCVVGPSGCGKTTLLRCLAGLLAADRRARSGSAAGRWPARRDGLAVVFQEYGRSLFPWLRVRENVELPLKAKGLPTAERRALVERGAGRGRAGRRRAPPTRGSSPAACSSGWRSPGRSPTSRGCC